MFFGRKGGGKVEEREIKKGFLKKNPQVAITFSPNSKNHSNN